MDYTVRQRFERDEITFDNILAFSSAIPTFQIIDHGSKSKLSSYNPNNASIMMQMQTMKNEVKVF